jgi:hypothetical protein
MFQKMHENYRFYVGMAYINWRGLERVLYRITEYPLKKLNSVAFSPQANYTDRATAACRRSSANFCG